MFLKLPLSFHGSQPFTFIFLFMLTFPKSLVFDFDHFFTLGKARHEYRNNEQANTNNFWIVPYIEQGAASASLASLEGGPALISEDPSSAISLETLSTSSAAVNWATVKENNH